MLKLTIDDKGHRRNVDIDRQTEYICITIRNPDNGTRCDVSLTIEEAERVINELELLVSRIGLG